MGFPQPWFMLKMENRQVNVATLFTKRSDNIKTKFYHSQCDIIMPCKPIELFSVMHFHFSMVH